MVLHFSMRTITKNCHNHETKSGSILGRFRFLFRGYKVIRFAIAFLLKAAISTLRGGQTDAKTMS